MSPSPPRPARLAARWLAAFVVVCASANVAADDEPVAAPILVSEHPCPDPYIFTDGEDWYVYGTGTRPFFLQGKEFGVGKMKKVFLEMDYSGYPGTVAQIWGFIVHEDSDHQFHGYGTLHLGNFHTVLACFEPNGQTWEKGRPITRWKYKSLLVGDASRQDWNYYETKILEDGRSRWLMYVARVGKDNWIVAERLKSWGEVDHSTPRRVILKPEGRRSEDRNEPGGMQLVEGGSIARLGRTYVLLYSVGDYLQSNYKLGIAFSDALIPAQGQTYKTIKLPDTKNIWGSDPRRGEVGYLLQSQKPRWPNYSGGSVVGPGLGSIVKIDDEPWLFFHGYKPDAPARDPSERYVYRVPLDIHIDRRQQPNLGWVRAAVSDARLRGKSRRRDRNELRESFGKRLVAGARWEGTSDWGKGRTTKSELRYVKTAAGKTEWEFGFLSGSIFNTPVPFRERWVGELVNNDADGIFLRLVRHDGKATHEYDLHPDGRLDGKAIGSQFYYRFAPAP